MRQLFGWAWLLTVFSSSAALQLPVLQLDPYPAAVRAQIAQVYQEAKTHPNDADALGKLGMVLQSYNEYQNAAMCFARAQALAPKETRWTYYAGLAQAALGNTAQALALWQQVPEYVPAQLKAADLLLTQNQIEAAGDLYAAVTRKTPASPWAWYGLGRVQAARQEAQAAIKSFEQALALAPEFGAAHYALALVLRDSGRLGKAKEHLALYQQYKLVRPALPDPWLDEIKALNHSAQEYLNRGLALESAGDLQGSVREHEQALAVDAKLLQAHLNLIQLYGRLAQPEQAEKHYRSALRLNPNVAEAHYNFGVVLVAAQRTTEAQAAFTRALASNPHYAEAHFNLGVLAVQEQKLTEAISHFRAALEANPNFRAAHFEWGRILVAQQQLAEAIRHFEQTLLPEDYETPRYLYALGATHIRAGAHEKGLAYLRQARAQAEARGQKELLKSLDRDLQSLEGK